MAIYSTVYRAMISGSISLMTKARAGVIRCLTLITKYSFIIAQTVGKIMKKVGACRTK